MKSRKWTLVALVAAMAISLSNAQTSHRSALTVKVPFDFAIGAQVYPAGTYMFESLLNPVRGNDTIDVLVVRSMEGRLYRAVVTQVVASDHPGNPRLVFARGDGRVFPLSEVWEPGKQAACRLRNRTKTAENEDDKVTLIASADVR